jgi:hypothetical protein
MSHVAKILHALEKYGGSMTCTRIAERARLQLPAQALQGG